MTYEEYKIKELANVYGDKECMQALDSILSAKYDYDENASFDGMLDIVNEYLSNAYEQGYKDALKEKED